MSEETLLTAARRVVRFYNIDQQHGGLPSMDTQLAVDTLDKMVRAADSMLRRVDETDAAKRRVTPDRPSL